MIFENVPVPEVPVGSVSPTRADCAVLLPRPLELLPKHGPMSLGLHVGRVVVDWEMAVKIERFFL